MWALFRSCTPKAWACWGLSFAVLRLQPPSLNEARGGAHGRRTTPQQAPVSECNSEGAAVDYLGQSDRTSFWRDLPPVGRLKKPSDRTG